MLKDEPLNDLDIVLPVYNEDIDVVAATISTIQETFATHRAIKIIIVDDGSDKRPQLDVLFERSDISFVQHKVN